MHMKKFVRMMNNGTLQLDELLNRGKIFGDVSGVGFTGAKNKTENVFEPERKNMVSNQKHEAAPSGYKNRPENNRFIPTYHYCNKSGHIKPRCLEYQRDLQRMKWRPTTHQNEVDAQKET